MVTLVLLPGLEGTGELFAPFIAAIGSEFRVRVVAYPTTEVLDYASLEVIARAALPATGPFILLGESFSGPIAISIARSGSPRLLGLVLCCTFARNPWPLLRVMRPLVRFLPVNWAPVAAISFMLLGRFSTPALRSALANALAKVPSPVLRARIRAVLSVDVVSKLADVRVPVLYLRGSRDRLVPHSASTLVSKLCAKTQVVEMEAPHFLLQTAPAEAARAVQCFAHEIPHAP